jgi:DNA repair protein RadD
MQKLIETLSRIGTSELANLIGRDTISILENMGGKQVSSYKLADLVLRQFGPEDLLLNKSSRTLLLETLTEGDASRLCRNLNLEAHLSPWDAIVGCKFQAGGIQSRTLFNFFGCDEPDRFVESDQKPSTIEITAEYPLFDHQIDACRRAAAILEHSAIPRVLLHMPTGAGKTRTAMNLIAHFARHRLRTEELIVWLAHSEELCEQAAEEFETSWKALGIRRMLLHRCYGANRPNFASITSGIMVGGLKMMFSRSQNEQSEFLAIAQKTKLVVMDEAHQAIAPTYKHLLDILAADPSTYVLGLSATPGRSTLNALEDLQLANFFSRQKVSLKVEGFDSPVDYLQHEGYLASVNYERLKFSQGREFNLTESERLSLMQGLDVPVTVLQKLGADESRNLLILNRILQEAEDPTRKIIAFACSVQHAHLIANILTVKGIAAAAITSQTRSANRRRLIKQFRDSTELQVLTNYGVLTTGFDAPKTNTAVIARPTDSVVLFSQMMGRAARGIRAGGNKECKVITIVDELPGFRSVAESFEYWNDIWD